MRNYRPSCDSIIKSYLMRYNTEIYGSRCGGSVCLSIRVDTSSLLTSNSMKHSPKNPGGDFPLALSSVVPERWF